MTQRIHIVVSGFVQGVFFRAHTAETATKLGLTGWVRNLPDGSVEITAEGSEENLDELVKWCSKGPPSATVTDMKTDVKPATGEFKSFSIK